MEIHESPASAVLRSLDIDPDAPLVTEPGPLPMRPSTLTPQQRAERERREADRLTASARLDRERREQRRRRWLGGGLG